MWNMIRNSNARVVPTILVLLSGAALVAQDQPAEFYFAGSRIVVGMPEAQAEQQLSKCCRLLPPTITDAGRQATERLGKSAGQMILAKDESEFRVLGNIYYYRGKVVSVTRPLGDYLPWSQDVLSFARALERSQATLKDSPTYPFIMSAWLMVSQKFYRSRF